MRTTYKLLTALAVFFIALCLCGTAYAQGDEEPPADEVPLLPPGTGTVVDTFLGDDGRKFYTIQTPAGNTFYLIIDFTRQSENVYFLDAVNERDLLALAQKANVGQPDGIPDIIPPNGNPAPEPPPGDGQTGQEPPPKEGGNNNTVMFAVVLAAVIGGGAVYFIRKRGAQKTDSRDEYEELEEYTPDDPGDGLETWGDDDE